MEINKMSDVLGVVATEDIPEGRMVLLTTNTPGSHNFGSRTDLPGVKLPDTSTEAAQAKFVAVFAQDNRSLPIYQTVPSFSFALRQGFDQASNVPFSATVHLTHPGNKVGMTIPSGELMLAFDRGVFTLPSGAYVYSANLEVPGAPLTVANTADDTAANAGKLKYAANGTIAMVERYDSSTGNLQVRTLV